MNVCPRILVALYSEYFWNIYLARWQESIHPPSNNLPAPSWWNMPPPQEKDTRLQRAARAAPPRWRFCSRVPGGLAAATPGLQQCRALLPWLFSASIPTLSTWLEAATTSQFIWPAHFLSQEIAVPCIFLVSKVPRNKRNYHKIFNYFWKQKKDCWTSLQRGDALPDMHACVFLPHKGGGQFRKTEITLKKTSVLTS